MSNNSVDLFQPIISSTLGSPPVVVRVITQANSAEYTGGVMSTATKMENYVLFSALPQELQERVKVAVQALVAGG
jgi:hypothetical protein